METFADWFDGERLGLLRFATALSADPGTAQDVVQEVAYRASTRWARIRDLDHPDAYLRRMVVNEYLSWRRKWSRMVTSSELVDLHLDVVGDGSAEVEDRHQLRMELRKLPPRQRAVIVLRFYDDLSDAEIARVLRCPRGTIRSLQSRALARLRLEMSEPPSAPVEPDSSSTAQLAIADRAPHQES